MRRLLRVTLVVFVALACGGCAERATRPDADIFGSGLRDAARGVAAGRAFDDALLAARRDDDAAFESATERLARSGAPKVASLSGALAVSRWLGEAESLNNLGYPLAENGRSMKAFVRAEELTRRSLAYWDKIIASQPEKSRDLPTLRFNRELAAHDSLAWALFRQKRFEEALREQQFAVAVATENAPKTPGVSIGLADMNYHLGKIHQALGHTAEAQNAFAQALKLRPDHPDAKREAGK